MKFEECMQKKITNNFIRSGIFDFFQFYWILFVFLAKKIFKIAIKREKNKIPLLISFLHTFTKFHVSGFILDQVITQNVILNKSHFCKKWHFLSKFGQFWTNFSKNLISKILFVILSMVSINFCAFNINITNFIGKNGEKITKNYPCIFYIKVKTPQIELVISQEQSWILTFRKKRWNHSNEFFE